MAVHTPINIKRLLLSFPQPPFSKRSAAVIFAQIQKSADIQVIMFKIKLWFSPSVQKRGLFFLGRLCNLCSSLEKLPSCWIVYSCVYLTINRQQVLHTWPKNAPQTGIILAHLTYLDQRITRIKAFVCRLTRQQPVTLADQKVDLEVWVSSQCLMLCRMLLALPQSQHQVFIQFSIWLMREKSGI